MGTWFQGLPNLVSSLEASFASGLFSLTWAPLSLVRTWKSSLKQPMNITWMAVSELENSARRWISFIYKLSPWAWKLPTHHKLTSRLCWFVSQWSKKPINSLPLYFPPNPGLGKLTVLVIGANWGKRWRNQHIQGSSHASFHLHTDCPRAWNR